MNEADTIEFSDVDEPSQGDHEDLLRKIVFKHGEPDVGIFDGYEAEGEHPALGRERLLRSKVAEQSQELAALLGENDALREGRLGDPLLKVTFKHMLAEAEALRGELEAAEARVREVEKVLRERDGGAHDVDCKARRYQADELCNCGHTTAIICLAKSPPPAEGGPEHE